MNKSTFSSSADAIINTLQQVTKKGDWVMVYNAFGMKSVNFLNKDLTNWIRTVFPIGKKTIFADLNKRVGTQLS